MWTCLWISLLLRPIYPVHFEKSPKIWSEEDFGAWFSVDWRMQRALETLKSELASKPVVQPIFLENQSTITTQRVWESYLWCHVSGAASRNLCVKVIVSSWAKVVQHWAWFPSDCFVGKRLKHFYVAQNSISKLIIVSWNSISLQKRNSQKPFQHEPQDGQFRSWPLTMNQLQRRFFDSSFRRHEWTEIRSDWRRVETSWQFYSQSWRTLWSLCRAEFHFIRRV